MPHALQDASRHLDVADRSNLDRQEFDERRQPGDAVGRQAVFLFADPARVVSGRGGIVPEPLLAVVVVLTVAV